MKEMSLEIARGIVVGPAVRFSKPVIRGTRVPVELILAKLAGGMTLQEVADEYELIVEVGRTHIRRPPQADR